MEEMDRSIGIILDKLDATGLSKSTLVFFASDNGAWLNPSSGMPGFGADNDIGPFDGGSNGPLFEGKGSTYEGGERVLAAFRWPGVIPGGITSTSVASMYDVLPTLLEFAGMQIPPLLDGFSLVPMLTGKNMTSPHTFMYFWRESVLYAIRYLEWKCHWITRAGFGNDPPVYHDPCLLFQINYDVGERIPLNAGEYPDILEILNQEYARVNQTTVRPPSQFEPQDWEVVPCCNGTVTLEKMLHLMEQGIVNEAMWQAIGCVC